ncbi:hypothetical protein [uncultured Friedmanniella sp.]|uniref:hypothetical protein n=1 Tax=uncultured Friedmanniella sp. TaxID=335381 RepID=UPI0035CC262E
MGGGVEFRSERPSWGRRGRLLLWWFLLTVVLQLLVALLPEQVGSVGLVVGLLSSLGLIVLVGLTFVPPQALVLTLGPDGLRSTYGTDVQAWSDVAAVWIGGDSALVGLERLGLSSRSLRVYSSAELRFGRRAGTRPRFGPPVPVPAGVPPEEVVAAIRRFTTVPIVVGGRRERRELERQLVAQA